MSSFKIRRIMARQVLDCRGEPTIEVDVVTDDGVLGRADVPAGRSTGKNEAIDLRDRQGGYGGRGVLTAVRNVNRLIGPALKDTEVWRQRDIDEVMISLDGTENKSKLGANATTGVSMACARCASNALGIPLYRYLGGPGSRILPVPFLDMIEGGKLAASDLDAQEHQLVPVTAKSFSEAIRMGMEVYQELGRILEKKWGRYSRNMGVEGGYTPPGMKDPRQALDAELQAAKQLGYGEAFKLALDMAASHLYNRKKRTYRLMDRNYTRERLIDYYQDLVAQYPIVSIEDPLEEEDFPGYCELTKVLKIQIIGDDLFVTNPKRLRKGIEMGAANALLLKVNQVGTLSEALDAAQIAFRGGYGVQVSERSAQTEDTWLADLTVGLNAGQIKTGVNRGERMAQYNQLLRIEEELGKSAAYAGKNFRNPS